MTIASITTGLPFSIQLLRLGMRSLLRHKLRSVLTMLGVVFGVGSVVSILAIGEGASAEIQAQWERLGPDRILVRSMPPPGPVSSDYPLQYGLVPADLARIEELVPGLRAVAPSFELVKDVHVGHVLATVPLICTTPAFPDIHQLHVARGRFITSADIEARSNVAVLGADVARALFGPRDPVGSQIKLGSGQYRVVGLLRPKGDAGGAINDPDESVFLPLTTAQLRLEDVVRIETGGGRQYEYVQLHQIGLRAQNLADVEQIAGMLRRMLGRFHPLGDFEIVVPYELLRQAEHSKNVFRWVLGSIAAISLLVGGIGIMNIMLATITERTREIGVRRAVGAKRWHVLFQFLVETVVLTTCGGILGLGVGVAIPPVITLLAGMQAIVTPGSLLLALSISIAVGIVFGMYPAHRAASMDPIEALRHA